MNCSLGLGQSTRRGTPRTAYPSSFVSLAELYAAQYNFTTIEYPGATWTEALGINDSGQIVEWYSENAIHGFIYDGSSFTSFDYPGGWLTYAYGINDSGQIVGYYLDSEVHTHGFLATPVPVPASLLLLGSGLVGLLGIGRFKKGGKFSLGSGTC